MKPPFSYYGGKARLSPAIVATFPEHETYVEPFLGSASVFFTKRPSRIEVLNDLDGAIVTFFRVLREKPAELELACSLTPYARTEFELAVDDSDLDDVERARRLWVRIVQSFRHVSKDAGPGEWGFASRGRAKAVDAQSSLARFYPCARRLADAVLHSEPAQDLIRRIDSSDAVFYVDPPYLEETRTAGARYRNELLGEDLHRDLADALASRPGHVAVSGYHSKLYDELYAGWHVLEFEVTSSAGEPKPRTEVLWTNYDPTPPAPRLFL